MTESVHRAAAPSRLGLARLLEFVRFAAVGASSTILYVALYTAEVLAGVPFLIASMVAFLPVAVSGYLLHDRWTFRTKAATGRGLGRWLLLQGTMLGLNIVSLWALVRPAGVDRLLAQIILLPLIPPTTYLLSRRRVFGAD